MEEEQGRATHQGSAGDISPWVWLGAPLGVSPQGSCSKRHGDRPHVPAVPTEGCRDPFPPGQGQPGQFVGVPQQGADRSPRTSSARLLLTGWDHCTTDLCC